MACRANKAIRFNKDRFEKKRLENLNEFWKVNPNSP